MVLPDRNDENNPGHSVIYGPIITLIDDQNNYYNFNEYSKEELEDKVYTTIIIQISHIPIKYQLEYSVYGVPIEILEYYDNNGTMLSPGTDVYQNVYQIKIDQIELLRLIAVNSESASALFTFYSSVIYLPAYTKFPQTLLKRDDITVDGFFDYINRSAQKPLRFIGLHKFYPKKSEYYYTFYDRVEITTKFTDDNNNSIEKQTLYDEIEKLKKKSIKLNHRKSNENELKEELRQLNEQLIKKEELYNELTAPPKPYSKPSTEKTKSKEELNNEMKQNTLRINRDANKKKSYFIIYTEENESGDADFFISPGTYPVHVVIGSIEIKDCIVYLYDESGKGTQHKQSENIEKKTYTKIDVTNYVDSFMQAQEQILYATVPVVQEDTPLLFEKEKELEEEARKLMEEQIKRKEQEQEELHARKLMEAEIKRKEEEEVRKLIEEQEAAKKENEEVFWFIVKCVVTLLLIFVIIKIRLYNE